MYWSGAFFALCGLTSLRWSLKRGSKLVKHSSLIIFIISNENYHTRIPKNMSTALLIDGTDFVTIFWVQSIALSIAKASILMAKHRFNPLDGVLVLFPANAATVFYIVSLYIDLYNRPLTSRVLSNELIYLKTFSFFLYSCFTFSPFSNHSYLN